MLTYTISFDPTATNKPYAIHLGRYGFYNIVDFAKSYEMAVEIATCLAKACKSANSGAPVAVCFTDDFFAPAKEIARV